MVLALASSLPMPVCSISSSEIWLSMVCTGLKAVIGSWKIIEISAPRILRMCSPSGSSVVRSVTAPSRPR